MENETTTQSTAGSAWQVRQVYAMAVISLVVGLAIGYLFRGSQSPAPAAQPVAGSAQPSPHAGGMGGGMGGPAATGGQMPTLDQMKQMAEKKAEPLLEKLKADPNNSDLLAEVAKVYLSTHQFKDAASYFGKAVQVDPKNVSLRTQMASCMYYDGDVDGAISQLQQSLHYSPTDANTLFNLGMIRWQGKKDNDGALAAWQQLLKSNPGLSPERRAKVQKLMADVQMQGKS